MNTEGDNRIVYSINIKDIQEVADQVLGRDLTINELALVENSIGDYLDWSQAIENAIHKNISE
jgi:hypothetical protein